MSELKPCPFCGSRAVVVDCGAEDGDPNAGGITVECVACRASVAVAFGENAHNAVCAAWNRRAEPPRGEALQWYADLATLRGYESLLAAVVGGAPLPKAAATDLLETIRRVRLAALTREPTPESQGGWPEKMTERAFVDEIIRRCNDNNEEDDNADPKRQHGTRDDGGIARPAGEGREGDGQAAPDFQRGRGTNDPGRQVEGGEGDEGGAGEVDEGGGDDVQGGAVLGPDPPPEPTGEPVAWRGYYMDHHGNEVWSGNALFSRADADEWAYRFRDLGPVMVPLYASPPVAQEGDADLASRLEDIADTIVNDVEMDAQGRLYACHDIIDD